MERTALYNGAVVTTESALLEDVLLVAESVGAWEVAAEEALTSLSDGVPEPELGTKTDENGFSLGGTAVLTEMTGAADFVTRAGGGVDLTTSENFFLAGVGALTDLFAVPLTAGSVCSESEGSCERVVKEDSEADVETDDPESVC